MAGNVLEFTDANFQSEVLSSAGPVLVDFWAPWCQPCKMIAPTIDAIATEYAGKLRVGKLNTDDNPQTASSMGISALPTLLLMKGGEVVEKFIGVVPKEKLTNALKGRIG